MSRALDLAFDKKDLGILSSYIKDESIMNHGSASKVERDAKMTNDRDAAAKDRAFKLKINTQ